MNGLRMRAWIQASDDTEMGKAGGIDAGTTATLLSVTPRGDRLVVLVDPHGPL